MIICIGNALVDSLQQIEEDVIDKLNLNKARMTLVDKRDQTFYLAICQIQLMLQEALQQILLIG